MNEGHRNGRKEKSGPGRAGKLLFILLTGLFLLTGCSGKSVGTVYLSGASKLKLEVRKDSTIQEILALNKAADALLNGTKWQKKPVAEALDSLLPQMKEEDTKEIYLDVFSNDKEWEIGMMESLAARYGAEEESGVSVVVRRTRDMDSVSESVKGMGTETSKALETKAEEETAAETLTETAPETTKESTEAETTAPETTEAPTTAAPETEPPTTAPRPIQAASRPTQATRAARPTQAIRPTEPPTTAVPQTEAPETEAPEAEAPEAEASQSEEGQEAAAPEEPTEEVGPGVGMQETEPENAGPGGSPETEAPETEASETEAETEGNHTGMGSGTAQSGPSIERETNAEDENRTHYGSGHDEEVPYGPGW